MYTRYLETAERHGFVAVMGGLDYRASPDWGAKLGYSRKGLAEMQLRAIEFLREIAGPFTGRLPGVLYAGIVGPRGDAYALNLTMTESEAEDYHAIQMETLGRAGVDLVSAMTFNAVPEAVGVSRAAAGAGLPLAVYFTLDGAGRLPSGPSLREAIERVDAQAGEARPGFYGINCSHPVEL
jgi:S-methylmethionine-dependent homocysteine/selenocysteine methylase